MKNIFLVIICLLAITGCWNDYPTYYISEEAKQWMDYKPGSWWVYQNDSTGILDCVWVDDYSKHLYRIEAGEKTKYKMEYIYYKNKTTSINKWYKIELIASGYITMIWSGEIYVSDSLDYNSTWGVMAFDSNIKDTSSTYNSVAIIENKFDSMNINSKWYKDVCKINVNVNNFGKINYWISKRCGILKFVINSKYSNESWTMQKHKTIQ